MDPRTRRSLYGIPTFDWTRGRISARASDVQLLWPDPFQLMGFELVRMLRRIHDTMRPGQVPFLLCRAPHLALELWQDLERQHAWLNWFERMKTEKPFGLLLVARDQDAVDWAVQLRDWGFPVQKVVVQAFPDERLDVRKLAPDLVRVGALAAEHYRTLPMRPEWVLDLADQVAHLEFFSWGGWVPREMAPPGDWKGTPEFAHIGSRPAPPLIQGRGFASAPDWWRKWVPGPPI